MSIANKLTQIAENQERVYQAGQKSMYDESKIIEKTASGISTVELTDVSEVIHDIHCQVEAVELLDMNKYMMRTTSTEGLLHVGFDISNLVEGEDYTIRSNLPLSGIRIGAYAPSYASVRIDEDITETTFTLVRHSAIPVTQTQYLFVRLPEATDYVTDISELEDYELSIQLANTNPENVTVTANGKEYSTNGDGFVNIKSDGPRMTISAPSWKLIIDYHRSNGTISEYDRFWDAFQQNGNLRNYQYTFCNVAWNDETFKPKYDIILGLGYSGTNAFWSCQVTNIAEALEKQGVKLDTTLCGYWSSMFQNIISIRLPELNCIHAMDYSTTYGFNNVFLNATKLRTIDKIITAEVVKYPNGVFQGCSSLENIVFEGIIGESINFQWSPLSVESMKSIISCLKDFSDTADAGTRTLTFTDDCWVALEADSSSPAGGTWEDYVNSLGWTT